MRLQFLVVVLLLGRALLVPSAAVNLPFRSRLWWAEWCSTSGRATTTARAGGVDEGRRCLDGATGLRGVDEGWRCLDGATGLREEGTLASRGCVREVRLRRAILAMQLGEEAVGVDGRGGR